MRRARLPTTRSVASAGRACTTGATSLVPLRRCDERRRHERPDEQRQNTRQRREGDRPVKVAVLMGSPNDMDKMKPAADILERFGIEADVRVLSAHRNPDQVVEL